MTDPPALPDARSILFSEPLLVVRQKPQIVDSTAVYAILDQNETHVGAVVDVGRRDLSAALGPERLGRTAPGIDSQARGFRALKTAFKVFVGFTIAEA
ncbi:MAG: hypothetical protein M3350_08220 [Actinomycetota bacterium]|nr:hypothetical protein [Actinomycetota bacterium]